MKVVVNRSFGGFSLGDGFMKEYGYKYRYAIDDSIRTDPRLIEWVENHPDDNKSLKIVDVPEETTDWQIHEYDGAEDIIAVINGKIVWL